MCEDCEDLEDEAEFYAQEAAKWKRMYAMAHKREKALAQQLAVLLGALKRTQSEVRGVGRN